MAPLIFSLVFALTTARFGVCSIGPVADLHIVNAFVAPDGYNRSATLAAGTLEGPLIVGNKNDTFEINVYNDLTNDAMYRSATIHWHGLLQSDNNFNDGVAMVSQCPITDGDSYLYKFTATNQAGTFWYHSHYAVQYCDGLRGPLIIYDPDDPYLDDYDVDNESTIITLSDWYHSLSPNVTIPATPDSTLINGLGRYAGGTETDLAVVTVEYGKRYRMRLLNTGCDPNFEFGIDQHNMTIIEVDGINHEKLTVTSINIFAGQRYSFILYADQPVDNYLIRADPSIGTLGYDGGINSAILRYVGANVTDDLPTSEPLNDTNPLLEADLHPLVDPAAPGNATLDGADVVLLINMTLPANGVLAINGYAYTSPTVPVLLQALSGTTNVGNLLPEGSIYNIQSGQVVQLTIPGGYITLEHPFHLHGHTFSVIKAAYSDEVNYVNPPRRDTVNAGPIDDYAIIRFTADNFGPWIFHCHIDWHLAEGLAIVFAEEIEDWNSTIPVTSAWDELCPLYKTGALLDESLGF
ncbi:laccase [Fistulina hepatica ATCC 64428]|uniref:Laccase n=1 Tax=Fistulina hepatica ATCC 64428 TaxID=1128425 RepID=A0A0D7AAH1_9AGAR|nr:laccase [Fistulina hepatica ATCC 64428]